jgi:hypothetical protein
MMNGKYPNRWQAGESGNPAGRPIGAHNRLSEAFIRDLSARSCTLTEFTDGNRSNDEWKISEPLADLSAPTTG